MEGCDDGPGLDAMPHKRVREHRSRARTVVAAVLELHDKSEMGPGKCREYRFESGRRYALILVRVCSIMAQPAGRRVQREDRVERKITHAPCAFGGSIHGGVVHRDQGVIRRELQVHFQHVYAERRRPAKRGHGIRRKEIDPARVGDHGWRFRRAALPAPRVVHRWTQSEAQARSNEKQQHQSRQMSAHGRIRTTVETSAPRRLRAASPCVEPEHD